MAQPFGQKGHSVESDPIATPASALIANIPCSEHCSQMPSSATIERLVQDYLLGRPLFIASARLRGPFQSGLFTSSLNNRLRGKSSSLRPTNALRARKNPKAMPAKISKSRNQRRRVRKTQRNQHAPTNPPDATPTTLADLADGRREFSTEPINATSTPFQQSAARHQPRLNDVDFRAASELTEGSESMSLSLLDEPQLPSPKTRRTSVEPQSIPDEPVRTSTNPDILAGLLLEAKASSQTVHSLPSPTPSRQEEEVVEQYPDHLTCLGHGQELGAFKADGSYPRGMLQDEHNMEQPPFTTEAAATSDAKHDCGSENTGINPSLLEPASSKIPCEVRDQTDHFVEGDDSRNAQCPFEETPQSRDPNTQSILHGVTISQPLSSTTRNPGSAQESHDTPSSTANLTGQQRLGHSRIMRRLFPLGVRHHAEVSHAELHNLRAGLSTPAPWERHLTAPASGALSEFKYRRIDHQKPAASEENVSKSRSRASKRVPRPASKSRLPTTVDFPDVPQQQPKRTRSGLGGETERAEKKTQLQPVRSAMSTPYAMIEAQRAFHEGLETPTRANRTLSTGSTVNFRNVVESGENFDEDTNSFGMTADEPVDTQALFDAAPSFEMSPGGVNDTAATGPVASTPVSHPDVVTDVNSNGAFSRDGSFDGCNSRSERSESQASDASQVDSAIDDALGFLGTWLDEPAATPR